MPMTSEKEMKMRLIANELVSDGGLLALDERPENFTEKLKLLNYENADSKLARSEIRNLILTTPGLNKVIRGVILHSESFEQATGEDECISEFLSKRNIRVGLKADGGLETTESNEKKTVGLDKLQFMLKNHLYKDIEFCKWRCVFNITDSTPTKKIVEQNCKDMATYAKICQKHGRIPVVEPEILWDGEYSINKAICVTKDILSHLIFHLNIENVSIHACIFKISYVCNGKKLEKSSDKETADATIRVVESVLPFGTPGVVFLSGGHDTDETFRYLSRIVAENTRKECKMSFSFGRAISDGALKLYCEDKKKEEIHEYMKEVLEKLSAVFKGEYVGEAEQQAGDSDENI